MWRDDIHRVPPGVPVECEACHHVTMWRKYFTIGQVAAHCAVTTRTVHKWIEIGKLKSTLRYFGNRASIRQFIPNSSLESLLASLFVPRDKDATDLTNLAFNRRRRRSRRAMKAVNESIDNGLGA